MDVLNELVDDLKLLGDKTRLSMLSLLKDREWCVCEFVELFDISQPHDQSALAQTEKQRAGQGTEKRAMGSLFPEYQ